MNLFPNQARNKQLLRGTSLVEVLLTLVLVLALIATAVISFSGTHAATALREGAERFESLIQFARAESSLTGKKHRLIFTESTNEVATAAGAALKTASLEVEANPVTEPGIFTRVTSAAVQNAEIGELIGVEAVKIPGVKKSPVSLVQDETETGEMEETLPEDEMGSITFYPDGSSDSVEIILAPKEGDEKVRMAVRLSGVTGTISRELMENGTSDTAPFDDKDPFWDEAAGDSALEAFESTETATTISTKADISVAATAH